MDYSMQTYTSEEITEMADTWVNYNGFSGELCGRCSHKANVLAGGFGWFCDDCGYYNAQSFLDFQIPHENPDMGTSANVIREGHKNSIKLKKFLKEYGHEQTI